MTEPRLTAEQFDRAFDAGEDITPHLELDRATRPGLADRTRQRRLPCLDGRRPRRPRRPPRHHPAGADQDVDRGEAGVRGGRLLAFDAEGHVEWVESNFTDYEANKIRRLGPDAVEPKRINYKKFAR